MKNHITMKTHYGIYGGQYVAETLMAPLKEKGAAGVREVLETMTKQLQVMMYRTASKDLKHIDPSVIWQR